MTRARAELLVMLDQPGIVVGPDLYRQVLAAKRLLAQTGSSVSAPKPEA